MRAARQSSRSESLRLEPGHAARLAGRGPQVEAVDEGARPPGDVHAPAGCRALAALDLLEHAWDFAYENRSNVIDVYVRYLREKVDRPFGAELDRDRPRRGLPVTRRRRPPEVRRLARIPIRVRLTLAFVAVMAVVLGRNPGAFLYLPASAPPSTTAIDQRPAQPSAATRLSRQPVGRGRRPAAGHRGGGASRRFLEHGQEPVSGRDSRCSAAMRCSLRPTWRAPQEGTESMPPRRDRFQGGPTRPFPAARRRQVDDGRIAVVGASPRASRGGARKDCSVSSLLIGPLALAPLLARGLRPRRRTRFGRSSRCGVRRRPLSAGPSREAPGCRSRLRTTRSDGSARP